MDNLLGNYSPESLVIVLSKGNFVHTIQGYADGSFLNIKRETPASTLYIGSDNTAGRVKRRNKASTITITLHQFSPSNAVLQALQRADEQDSGNAWVVAMTIKDLSGTSIWSSNQTFIGTIPDAQLGSAAENRAWELHAVSLSANIGTNTLFDAAEVNAMTALGATVDPKWKL
jgi:hypothetical protein